MCVLKTQTDASIAMANVQRAMCQFQTRLGKFGQFYSKGEPRNEINIVGLKTIIQ